MLEALGLDAHTEAVYRGMLANPTSGIAELGARLRLSESQVRDGLDRLVDLNLLRASRDAPGALRPVSPESGLEELLRRQEADLARRQQELIQSKAAAARAVAEFAGLRPNTETQHAERLIGLDAIQSRLEILSRELRQECLSIMPGGAQSPAGLDASRPLDEDAMARNVRMRAIYQDAARNDAATFAYAQWTVARGGEVRTSAVLPPRLLIFDRTTAVVPIDPAHSRQGALCTTAPGIVASLVALFELTWDSAVPLEYPRRRVAGDGITSGEKELLKLLASGLTDETAARRLGVSLRTVRRQMASLMERLNVTSRFAAGLKAGQRGWL
ncbi:helix-turn-helix transcriptional regulator [Streptomyces sp. WAC 06783]|uniref:helix-turn-helix transcriptional regulator n=1 Tax=Streptomyces TaxID=1883 RepID=UPI000F74B698|nr:helix-turn-helix transcriptional regulator [Streptomyces sp. WAC 06783]RSO10230.1 helix-turn-helix transcriptional regulator [Streptomyces sp. WAC 06783]